MIPAALIESAPFVLFLTALVFIWLHTAEEMGVLGGKSFWRYYGEHFVLRAGDVTGFALFFGLGASLSAVAYLGLIHEGGSAWWRSALLGLFAADFLLSHVGLSTRFRADENPGLMTSFNYAAFVGLTLLLLQPMLSVGGFWAGYAVFAGWWAFSFKFLRRRNGRA